MELFHDFLIKSSYCLSFNLLIFYFLFNIGIYYFASMFNVINLPPEITAKSVSDLLNAIDYT